MVFEFRLPDIGEGVAEGEVVQWFVKEGETVKEDAPLVSVLTDKANVEIPSPKSGKVLKIHAQVGEKVKVGGVLVSLDTGDGSAATAPVPPRESSPPPSSTVPPPPSSVPASSSSTSRILATPSVRRLAAERGVDLSTVQGSGPGGRIVESDVAGGAPAASPPPTIITPPTPTPAATTAAAPPSAPAPDGEAERVPIRGIRRVIAEHMAEATHRAAHYTYVEEVDASDLVRHRDRMAKHIEKNGLKLTYLPFIVRSVVAGLKQYPWMNARMDDERQELVVHRSHHIGIAAAGPDGLVVPVVRDADHKSIAVLAREIQDLAERARTGKLKREEMIGGTFTITSLGALGGVLATPILNYPEVAILGVHKISRRPVYLDDGSVGPAHMMNLSVSLDHRVLDGIVGAQFLAAVKAHLEDPHLLFAELS